MGRHWLIQAALIAAILLPVLTACNSDQVSSTSVNGMTAVAETATGLPLPAQLARQLSVEVGERFSFGTGYLPGHTANSDQNQQALILNPDYDPAGDDSSNLAWAVYGFSLLGYLGNSDLLLGDLVYEGLPENLWIGLGDLDENKWDWIRYDPAALPDLGLPDSHTSPDGQVLVAVSLMGNQPAELGWLRIGGPVDPVADLTADVTDGSIALAVSFDASGSYGRGSQITDFHWDFDGDGEFSESDNGEDLADGSAQPVYTYTTGGVFNAAVQVTDADELTDTAEIEITVTAELAISGRVELPDGTGIPDVEVVISGAADDSVMTDALGDWSTAQLPGSYRATPQKTGWLFLPGFTEFELVDSEVVLDPFVGSDGWVHTWGGPQEDNSSSVEIDPAGFVYSAGRTYSFGAGNRDVLVQKYDFLGNHHWTKTWGGTENEIAYGTDLDANGNLYVVGYTTSFGAGGYDMFILRYLPDGTLDWQQTWGNVGLQEAFDIKALADGRLLVAGRLSDKTALISFDATGQAEWGQLYWVTGTGFNYARSLAIDALGNIYMAGFSYYSAGGNYNSLVLKYNSTGVIQWAREWDRGTNDQLYGIELDSFGDVIVGGNCNNGNGAQDALIIKYGAGGGYQWEKVWGSSGFEHIYAMAQDGDVTIMSGMYGTSGRMLNLAVNTSGTIEWSWGFNMDLGSETCTAYSAGVFPNGMLMIGGIGPNINGFWEEVTGETLVEQGTTIEPVYSTNDISTAGTTQTTPTGNESEPMGSFDTGGGIGDAILATFTPPMV